MDHKWSEYNLLKNYVAHEISSQGKFVLQDKTYSYHYIPVWLGYTVKLGYIKLGFYEYMVYIEVLSRPERNPIDFHVK